MEPRPQGAARRRSVDPRAQHDNIVCLGIFRTAAGNADGNACDEHRQCHQPRADAHDEPHDPQPYKAREQRVDQPEQQHDRADTHQEHARKMQVDEEQPQHQPDADQRAAGQPVAPPHSSR